jgi:hypothetical protein
MNAREASQLLREKLPEDWQCTIHEGYSTLAGMKPFTASIALFFAANAGAPLTPRRVFELPSSQPVADFSAAARAAIDWARNQELAEQPPASTVANVPAVPEKTVSPTLISLDAQAGIFVRHQWRPLWENTIGLYEFNALEEENYIGAIITGSSFYWTLFDTPFDGYAETLDAAKAACIAKRLEILEKGK